MYKRQITRCGFTIANWLNIENKGCELSAPRIQINLDPLVEFEDASLMPDSINGQILIWNLDSLSVGELSQVRLMLKMPNENFVDEEIAHLVQSFYQDQNSFILDQSFQYSSLISCAIDPNDKQVRPDRTHLSEENYTLSAETLNYQIRFQNTGNDTCLFIHI